MKTNFNTNAEIITKKTTSKSLIVIISIALISLSLNAQDFEYTFFDKFNLNETALAMSVGYTEIRPAIRNSDVFLTFAETETEESLQVEDWMIDENRFSTLSNITGETESPMQLESWMSNTSFFGSNSAYMETAAEETLELEDWMLKVNIFSSSTFELKQETENTMQLENWMLNDKLFSRAASTEKPMILENWMVSEIIWN